MLNALRSRQIDKVGQVLTMDPDQLLSIRNFGPRSLNELREKLAEFGYLPEGEVGVLSATARLPRRARVGDGRGRRGSIRATSPRRLRRCSATTVR